MRQHRAIIRDIAYYLPEKEIDNDILVKSMGLDWSAEDIFKKTGIRVRHITNEDQCASDIGIEAARKLFATGVCKAEDIDFLLLCTQSPDYFLPATACIVHRELGLKRTCGALDYNQGCSGFVYGLALAKGLIETANAQNVLLITAETYSKHINAKDRSTRTIFGDGAAATLLSAIEHDEECIGPLVLGTDGTGAENLIVPAGGMRLPLTAGAINETIDQDGNMRSKANLYMNGPEIFNFSLKAVPSTVRELLAKANIDINEIDYFVFHQANQFMLEHLRKKMKIPAERFWIRMAECGNTVSATIPVAIKMAMDGRCIKKGDHVMLVGFGVGYSWGACMVRIM